MTGNNFKEKKGFSLIFKQFWSRSHLSKLDRLTPQDVYCILTLIKAVMLCIKIHIFMLKRGIQFKICLSNRCLWMTSFSFCKVVSCLSFFVKTISYHKIIVFCSFFFSLSKKVVNAQWALSQSYTSQICTIKIGRKLLNIAICTDKNIAGFWQSNMYILSKIKIFNNIEI